MKTNPISKKLWRWLILLVVLGSFFGPWVIDSINVPAEYECQPPGVRMDGDSCGYPISGAWVMQAFAIELPRSLMEQIQTTVEWDEVGRLFLGLLFLLILLLPLPAAVAVAVVTPARSLLVAHLVISLLGVAAGLLPGLSYPLHVLPAVWGVWLYIATVIGGVILDVVEIRRYKRDIAFA
jgi:hypothetical protein